MENVYEEKKFLEELEQLKTEIEARKKSKLFYWQTCPVLAHTLKN